MAKTLVLDGVQMIFFQVLPDRQGGLRVHCEYALKQGAQVALTRQRDVTTALNPARMAQVQALLAGLAQDVAAIEL